MSFSIQYIKFISIIKEEGFEPVTYFSADSFSESSLLKESIGAFTQIKRLELTNSERQRFNKDKTIWNTVKDSKYDIYYLVLTTNSYPERHAYSLLNKVQELVQQVDINNDSAIKKKVDASIKELHAKYNDLQSLDKMLQAQIVLDQTQAIMQENVKKVIEGQKDIESLSKKAEEMKNNAFDFQKNSAELKKIMYERNLKLKIIIGAMGVGFIGYIVTSFI